MPSNPTCREDRRLKERCLGRENAAWGLLHAAHFPGLVAYARALLVIAPIAGLTPEDVAADVFSFLCENDCHLIRYYDPRLIPWQGFLRLLAKRLILTHRRREHPCPLGDRDYVDPGADGGLAEAQFHEYVAALPPTLKQWLEDDGFGITDPTTPPCSPEAKYKRRQRAFRRAADYFGST